MTQAVQHSGVSLISAMDETWSIFGWDKKTSVQFLLLKRIIKLFAVYFS